MNNMKIFFHIQTETFTNQSVIKKKKKFRFLQIHY